jgi:hypothetical protein
MIVPILIGVPVAMLVLLVELEVVEELQAATLAANATKAVTQVTDPNLVTAVAPFSIGLRSKKVVALPPRDDLA